VTVLLQDSVLIAVEVPHGIVPYNFIVDIEIREIDVI